MRFSAKEDVIQITPLNPFDRFDDGRPRVPDDLLERMKLVSAEEAWTALTKSGYKYQFEGDWINLHPEHILVGRAITVTIVPIRPDLHDVVNAQADREGRRTHVQVHWPYHNVKENDVIVVDVSGIKGGCIGDNLAVALATQGGAGVVTNGIIRDPQGVYDTPNINVFCRGFESPPFMDGTMISLNGPTRIGQTTVLPGDIVLGTRVGVTFIPPHLVEEVITTSDDVRLKDEYRHQRMQEHKYTVADVYSSWEDEIEADFQEWRKQHQS